MKQIVERYIVQLIDYNDTMIFSIEKETYDTIKALLILLGQLEKKP